MFGKHILDSLDKIYVTRLLLWCSRTFIWWWTWV